MAFAMVAGGISAIGGLVKTFHGIHQNNLANRVKVPNAELGANSAIPLAQQIFNGRMAGSGYAEQNIAGNQANAMGSVERNATSSGQALSLISAIQGQSNNAYQGLNQQEGNYKLNAFNNLANLTTGEQERQYMNDVRKRQEAIGEKSSLRGSGAQNISAGINELGSTAYMASNIARNNNTGLTPDQRIPNAAPELLPYR